jgi:hypothetical protein
MAHDLHFFRNSALYVSQEGQTNLMDLVTSMKCQLMEIETTRQDLLRKKIQENERKKDKNRKDKELIVNEVQY